MRELEALYEETRARITELVADLDDADAIPAPACPEWSVKDVVSHVTGNGANVLDGNIVGVATSAWTAAQVAERRDRKLGYVLAEWDDVGPKFASILDDFPGHLGRQAVSDLVVHEHDLRGALGRPGARDTDGVRLATDFAMTMIVHPGATARGLGPLEVTAGDRRWIVGTGEPASGKAEAWRDVVVSDAPPPAPTKPPVGSVDAPPFELFRAITGRRSADQIRRFDWHVDPDGFIALFGSDPFALRDSDLEE